jgi:hypothetical protein
MPPAPDLAAARSTLGIPRPDPIASGEPGDDVANPKGLA